MMAPVFADPGFLFEAGVRVEIVSKGGGQDTSRTPKHMKTSCFQVFGAGALVGARAARKEKSSNFNALGGTSARFGTKMLGEVLP